MDVWIMFRSDLNYRTSYDEVTKWTTIFRADDYLRPGHKEDCNESIISGLIT